MARLLVLLSGPCGARAWFSGRLARALGALGLGHPACANHSVRKVRRFTCRDRPGTRAIGRRMTSLFPQQRQADARGLFVDLSCQLGHSRQAGRRVPFAPKSKKVVENGTRFPTLVLVGTGSAGRHLPWICAVPALCREGRQPVHVLYGSTTSMGYVHRCRKATTRSGFTALGRVVRRHDGSNARPSPAAGHVRRPGQPRVGGGSWVCCRAARSRYSARRVSAVRAVRWVTSRSVV